MFLSREGKFSKLSNGFYDNRTQFNIFYGGWINHNGEYYPMIKEEGHWSLIDQLIPLTNWRHADLFKLGWIAISTIVNQFDDKIEVTIACLPKEISLDSSNGLERILKQYNDFYSPNVVFNFDDDEMLPSEILEEIRLVSHPSFSDSEIDKKIESEIESNSDERREQEDYKKYLELKQRFDN